MTLNNLIVFLCTPVLYVAPWAFDLAHRISGIMQRAMY